MSEMKGSREDFMASAPMKRVKLFRWWYILLILGGLLAAYWAVRETSIDLLNVSESVETNDLRVAIVGVFGFEQDDEDPMAEFKPYVMVGIYALLAICMLISLGVTLFSSNMQAVDRAGDVLKTTLGFFIGAVTGLI